MIILQGITVDEFYKRIESIVSSKLNEILEAKRRNEREERLLTRKEVCSLLRVSAPTLHDWTKQGLIKAYRIGSRVLYKSSDVEAGLILKKYNTFQHKTNH